MVEKRLDIGKRPGAGLALWQIAAVIFGLAVIVVFVLALMGPAVGNVFSGVVSNLAVVPDSSDSGYTHSIAVQIPQRVIIREGFISLIVEDTRASQGAVEEMVDDMAAAGAFIITSEERGETDDQMPAIHMVIRVPSEQFDETMDRLAALSVRVLERREVAQDVTEEYIDLQARLETMEAARERLRDIMSEAETVEDLLRAEQQLAEREAQIESLQGRLEYLTQSAQLSKIEINLQPSVLNQPIGTQWQPSEMVRKAFAGLVSSVQGAINILIYFGIVILPWLVAIGLIAYGVRRIGKRYRARRIREKAPDLPSERSS